MAYGKASLPDVAGVKVRSGHTQVFSDVSDVVSGPTYPQYRACAKVTPCVQGNAESVHCKPYCS